jgi:hypothetical protein
MKYKERLLSMRAYQDELINLHFKNEVQREIGNYSFKEKKKKKLQKTSNKLFLFQA